MLARGRRCTQTSLRQLVNGAVLELVKGDLGVNNAIENGVLLGPLPSKDGG